MRLVGESVKELKYLNICKDFDLPQILGNEGNG
jgi:hypothetical protein